jgi:hypothetical protein
MFGLVIAVTLATASPTATPKYPPSYLAVNYDKPGHHPPLTAVEVARIRQVLAQVKPCQRPLVHYVLWERSFIKEGVALFFLTGENHVFGYPNVVWWNGNVQAGPNDMTSESDLEGQRSIQWDIDRQSCPPNSK